MSSEEDADAPSPPARGEAQALDDEGGYFGGSGGQGNNQAAASRLRGSESLASLDNMGFDDEDEDEDDDEGAGLDRIRALMLNFYGADGDALDGDGDGSGGGYSAGDQDRSVDRSMDIDHAAFDPAAYVLRAVRDDPLTDLLQADETLVSEVQELNNDMQNLVYENYNKFIDATDTIRKMKDQVEGMESEIELLIKTMDSVDTRTQDINARLQPKRNKIENMVSLQRLIKRLEFLFELPMRLKRSIELEAFSQAVKYFNMASGILEKYSDVASFGAIQVESKEIMSSLKSRIVASLEYRPEVRPSAISENMRLLIDLGDPRAELAASFFAWYKKRLEFRVGEIRRCLDTGAATNESAETAVSEARDVVMWGRNTAFLSDMNTFLESHGELFGADNGDDGGSSSGGGGDGAGRDSRGADDLKTVVRGMFTEYFGVMRAHLVGGDGGSAVGAGPVSDLLSLLEKFKSELRESSQLLRGHSLRMRLDDRAAEIMEHVLRTRIVHTFRALKKSLAERMASGVGAVENIVGGIGSNEEETTESEEEPKAARFPESSAPGAPSAPSTKAAEVPGNPFGNVSDKDQPEATASGTGNPFGKADSGGGGSTGNPFAEGEPRKNPEAGNPFSSSGGSSSSSSSSSNTASTAAAHDLSAKRTAPSNEEIAPSSNDSKNSPHNLAAMVRSTVLSLASEIEATLNAVRPLLETTSSRRRGALLPGMDSVFLDLVRGEFESTVAWLAWQCEQQCDRVGTDITGSAIGISSVPTRRGDGRSASVWRPSNASSSNASNAGGDTAAIFDGPLMDCLSSAFRENARYVFAASCIFRELSRGGISGPCDALEELYENISSDSAVGNLDASPMEETIDELNSRCGDCATALLSHFVGLRSRFAVRSVRQRLDYIAAVSRGADSEADDSTEPNAIDDLAFIIVQGAREISKDAQALLGRGGVDSKSGRDDSASGGDSTSGGGIGGVSDMQFRGRGTAGRDTTGGGAMRNGPTPGNVAISIKGGKGKKVGGMSGLSLDIDRLFAKKVSVFSAPKFSCSSLLQEFFCVVFKALSEHVRELTLVRAAFQEVQLIARFLFDMMPVFVGDNTEALDALLAEFVNSAHTRCLDQAPGMSEHAVDTLVNQAKSEQEEGGADAYY